MALRKARGWTREQVAVRLNVSLTTVANLESGKHQPRLQRAREIAQLFGVSVEAIEWGAPTPKRAAA
jgi:transcriptional regulator with XRE-family HTH domain